MGFSKKLVLAGLILGADHNAVGAGDGHGRRQKIPVCAMTTSIERLVGNGGFGHWGQAPGERISNAPFYTGQRRLHLHGPGRPADKREGGAKDW
jgi:hypothetical protein